MHARGISEKANRRRLELLRGITAPSLAAQSTDDFCWLVLVDERDPLLDERCEAVAATGIEHAFLHFDADLGGRTKPRLIRQRTAALGYQADWAAGMGDVAGPILTTRLDDDDALAPDTLERVRTAAEIKPDFPQPLVWLHPEGFRVWDGRYDRVRHETNAYVTLQAPDASTCVYDFNHKRVGEQLEIRIVDERPAWLWVRHRDALSRHRVAGTPIDDELRSLFPVDWELLEAGVPA